MSKLDSFESKLVLSNIFSYKRCTMDNWISGVAVNSLILFLILIGLITPVLASDDAYLKELEAEAQNLSTKNAAEPAPADTQTKNKAATVPVPEATVNLRKAEFETALKAELPNTYTIYTRLTAEQKLMVVETYFANDRKIAPSSKQVFDFYLFDRKRQSQIKSQ